MSPVCRNSTEIHASVSIETLVKRACWLVSKLHCESLKRTIKDLCAV